MLACRSEVANESHRSFCEEQKKINKWGCEFSTEMKKESCSLIIKSPLVITQSQNFAKGTLHDKCTRKVQMQRTEEAVASATKETSASAPFEHVGSTEGITYMEKRALLIPDFKVKVLQAKHHPLKMSCHTQQALPEY